MMGMLILSMTVGVALSLMLADSREISTGAAVGFGLLLGPIGALIVFMHDKKWGA